MSLLAEKMNDAGVDTLGARLTSLCVAAAREHKGDPAGAWRYVGLVFGQEFIRGLMKDMEGSTAPPLPSPTSAARTQTSAPAPYKPRVIPKERLENRRKLQEIVRSKFKNSSGLAWSEVGWHELPVLARDGREAAALLAAGPAHAPNDGRSVGAVLGVKQVDLIIGAVRA